MKQVQYLIVGCLILLSALLIVATGDKKSAEPETKLSVYVTRTSRVHTVEDKEMWILEYTVNGELHAPAFDSREAMAEYREYLDTIGRVYQREGKNE
jgi:hypothetical protein